jgi:hypothetical protein
MVARVERVAHEHGVAALRIELAVRLVGQRVVGQGRTASQQQRLRKMLELCFDLTDRLHEVQLANPGIAAPNLRRIAPAEHIPAANWR